MDVIGGILLRAGSICRYRITNNANSEDTK